jgi:hypothetical protein
MSQHKEQLGFLTFAINSEETDYLRLAYLQALNIKATQKNNSCAVVVNTETAKLLTDEHKKTFDHIIEITNNDYGSFGYEHLAFGLTPYKETIKLESDLLFTRSIDHWIHAFRLRDIVLSTGCRNYQQKLASSRRYRKLFDDNNLPDTYNGLMYFRYSQTATDFFKYARIIFNNWEVIQNSLLNCRDQYATTDVVYAIAARIVGDELCTIPSADFINFVHMKPSINNFNESNMFEDVYVSEFDHGMIRINNINQYHPLHYYDKKFAKDEMIEYYESCRRVL